MCVCVCVCVCVFSNILQKISSQKSFYEKVKMITKRIAILESFITVGSCDYDHTHMYFMDFSFA